MALPAFVFNCWPHKWLDPILLPNLAIFDGPYIKPVRDNPGEYVRDAFVTYEYLRRQTSLLPERPAAEKAWEEKTAM